MWLVRQAASRLYVGVPLYPMPPVEQLETERGDQLVVVARLEAAALRDRVDRAEPRRAPHPVHAARVHVGSPRRLASLFCFQEIFAVL